ncbi:hypothetical protein SALBM217S_00418 [Streptomyces griseoloalbus]
MVRTCGSIRPELSSQAALNSSVPSSSSVRSALSSGVPSCWKCSSSCWSSSQVTGALRPTPRGSKLTRSYRVRRVAYSWPNAGSVVTPEPPGPPKLKISEPIRSLPGPLDRTRIRARPMVSPSGSSQSSGAFSVAHSHWPRAPGSGEGGAPPP